MDPISAIGIAAAVAQFMVLGVRVAQRLADYSAASPLDTPRDLQNISLRLPLLLNSLAKVKTEEQASKYDIDSRCMLRGVVAGCLKLVEEIEVIAEKLRPEEGENVKTKLKKVLSSLNSNDKIAEIDRGLQTYIQVLILHHVVDRKEYALASFQESGFFEVKEKLETDYGYREDLMSQIDECFRLPIRRQTEQPQFAILAGRAGSGKTQLALGYCREAFDESRFRMVFWLDGSSAEALQLSIESAASAIRRTKEGTPQEKTDFVQNFLAGNWEPWLIVVDNYNHEALSESHLLAALPKKGYGGVLIVSRSLSLRINGKLIKVTPFVNEEKNWHYGSELQGAIQNGNVDLVDDVVAKGFNVDQEDRNGWPHIERAAIYGHEAITRTLLLSGADIHKDPTRLGALYFAAGDGYLPVVTVLLDHEDKIGKFLEKKKYVDALAQSIKGGHVDVARTLLTRRDIDMDMKNDTLSDNFVRSAREGKMDMLRFLHELNAIPKDEKIRAEALIRAIDEERVDVAKFFIQEVSFSPNATGDRGNFALKAAAQMSGSPDHVEPIRLELVKMLLAAGANPNQEADGTALVEAALRESEGVVKLLLESGADPTITNNGGYSALESASKYKSPKVFPLLVNVDIVDAAKREKYFKEALFYSGRTGDRELLAAIADKVDLDSVEDHSGDTALLLAVRKEKPQVARYLVRKKAKQTIRDREDNLPVLIAAKKGMQLVVRDLFKAADSPGMEVTDAKGNTALIIAAEANQKAVVEELIKMGANKDAENSFGEIAMDIAEEKMLKEIIKALDETVVS